MLKSLLSARPVIEALEARIAPATFTVTTTADSGPGSLRQAILDANALQGADTIGFDIEGDQLQVISLLSALPAITDQVTMTASGEKVRIDGAQAGSNAHGIVLTGTTGSVISGLEIAHFAADGIRIEAGGHNNVSGNRIFSNRGNGVHIIGGTSNRLSDNTIGVSTTVSGSTGNFLSGVLLEDTTSNTLQPEIWITGLSNTINGNGLFGVEIRGGAGKNLLVGNRIEGNGARQPNGINGGGIGVIDSPDNMIGGEGGFYAYTTLGNQIINNKGAGILITGQLAARTVLKLNTISGTDGDGIRIDGAPNTRIGDMGTASGRSGVGESVSVMRGNTIGTSEGWNIAILNLATQTTIRGNTVENAGFGGILIDHSNGVQIGTELSSDRNTLQSNTGAGITVRDSLGVNIASNIFTESTGLPVDLGGDGGTPNDPQDADTGANHLQNYPSLFVADGQLTGTLSTDAVNTLFRINIYTFDPATYRYSPYATREVTTDATGSASLAIQQPLISPDLKYFATATNINTGETSELSAVAQITPRISIKSATAIEGNSGIQNATFTVSLDRSTTIPVKVSYRSSDGTAKMGEDYGAVEGVLVFEPGETTKTISVPVFGDPVEEASESFLIQLTSAENGILPATASVTGTIINDDGLPTISIQDVLTVESANPSNTHAGYSEIQYTLNLSKTSLDPVTVTLSAVGGTATVWDDYDAIGSTITFAPGTTSVTKTLYIKSDTVREETETIQLQLSNPTAGTLGNANATVSILDDDTWQIQADAVQIAEGNDGQSVAVMKVRLANSYGVTNHTHPISVDFNTQNGTAITGSDYVATEGALTFQPGEIEKTISVPILGDRTAEQNENFSVKFSTPFGATLQQASQTVSILNDDPGTISVASASITEGHSGQKMLVFNVTMPVPTISPVSVNFETQDGTALAGADFEAVTGQITFAPGETQKTVSVPILGDRVAEQSEAFTLKLTGASGATIATAAATGTILNDDPLISIENAQFLEGQPSTPSTHSVYLPVRLSQATDIPISVDFTTSNGSAEASSDYIATSGTVTFVAGQTLQYIELQIIGDQIYEPDETFSVKLSNPHGAEIGTDTGAVTIKADEPFISAQDVTIAEGHSGTNSLVFTVNLSHAQNSAVTVDYTTADGTATAGSDYAAISGTLAFAPGETTKAVSIPVQGDTVQEANETVRLLLSGATGATLVQDEATGTILNDDVTLGATNLIISKGGRKATWTDSDGDLVTLVATKPVLTLSSFHFGQADGSDNLVLEQLDATFLGNVKPFGLDFSVKKSATGDGLVNVGEIDATGRDLTTISLPGRLGAIQAGDSNLNTPAIRKLTVNSFGMDSATAQTGVTPLLSEVKGSIGSFAVKHDFTGANLIVSGGSVQSLVIGGDIEGISSEAPSGISIEKNLSTLKVGGDVSHTNVLAGTGSQKGAHVGQVLVKGNWSASNLAVGAGAGADGYFGTEDDIALQDTASRIARITIRGAVSGTAEAESATDHFGFVAGRIAAFQVGAQKLDLSSKWKDSMEVGSTFDVMLRELAGRSRA